MRKWMYYGYVDTECDDAGWIGLDSTDDEIDCYIESRRTEYYDEFYEYLRENGADPFLF